MRKTYGILLLLVSMLSLMGCGEEKQNIPQATPEKPRIAWGIMESIPLDQATWDCGRLEYTSGNTMAETELGYYLAYQNYLFYADKENLHNWVFVCGDPSCNHRNKGICRAGMVSNNFIIVEDRIIKEEASTLELSGSMGAGNILVSTDLRGDNKKAAFVLEEGLSMKAGGSGSALFFDSWFYILDELDNSGNTRSRLFRVTHAGTETLSDVVSTDGLPVFRSGKDWYRLYGDQYFYYSYLFDQGLCRFEDGEIVKINFDLIPENGGCVTEKTLRTFQKNRGYFDIHIETGKKEKIGQPQLKNSQAVILLPNCIVETTLLWEQNKQEMQHSMILFDGEGWTEVWLPEELLNASKKEYIQICGVSSDRLFFMLRHEDSYRAPEYLSKLYTVKLGEESLRAEYCCDLSVIEKDERT